jgi:HEPN domain-containing protein
MNKAQRRTIEGWIEKASHHLQSAHNDATPRYRHSEAVQAAQQCTELSVNAVLSLLAIAYPTKHEWGPEKKEFALIAHQITERDILQRLSRQDLSPTVPLPRLLLLTEFWGHFYLVAKYGFEIDRLAPAEDLFRAEEAKLAIQHAEECYRAASALRYLNEEKLMELQGHSASGEGAPRLTP